MCWLGDNITIKKIAERDFYVYKIGNKANKNAFVPYFIGSFKYLTDISRIWK